MSEGLNYCTCQPGRDYDGSEFGPCPYCEEQDWLARNHKEEGEMSDYYIDKGIHRTFRYEARGSDGTQGYTLGSFRSKAEALEAVLKDKREQKIHRP